MDVGASSALGQAASDPQGKSPTISKEPSKGPPVQGALPAPVKRAELPAEVTGLLEPPKQNAAQVTKESKEMPKKETRQLAAS